VLARLFAQRTLQERGEGRHDRLRGHGYPALGGPANGSAHQRRRSPRLLPGSNYRVMRTGLIHYGVIRVSSPKRQLGRGGYQRGTPATSPRQCCRARRRGMVWRGRSILSCSTGLNKQPKFVPVAAPLAARVRVAARGACCWDAARKCWPGRRIGSIQRVELSREARILR
jgi:hypothetical protein